MTPEVTGWVATAVGAPIVIVTLCWTLVIYRYHRRRWRAADLLIAALLAQGIVKQLATFLYTILTLLQPTDFQQEWCSSITWLLTSVHILQAGTLATLIVTRLLAVRFPGKYHKTVKRTHLIYHLVTLSILSSCIGIAAVLAEGKASQFVTSLNVNDRLLRSPAHCSFLPHELDARYAILSITLTSLLIVTSLLALIVTLFSWCMFNNKMTCQPTSGTESQPSTIIGNRGNQRQLLLTSSSDLSAMSDLSLGSTAPNSRSASATQNCGGERNGRATSAVQRKCGVNGQYEGLLLQGFIDVNCGKFVNGLLPKTSSENFDVSNNLFNNSPPNKSSSDNGPFQQNLNVFHPIYASSSNHFMNATMDKSSDIYKSTSAIFNNTGPKSLTTNGSNYDGTYERRYAAAGHGINEDASRWTSEPSYMSTSTSSTNSRAPCLTRQPMREETNIAIMSEDLKLGTACSVLGLCYLLNHLPLLVVTIVGTFLPHMIPPTWPLTAMYLWAGMAEQLLLPVILTIFDTNFTAWVASVYSRDRIILTELAKQQQGLDGKFRVFNSQLQTLQQTQVSQHLQPVQQAEPTKFPITNGSLFTSVDGRLPIIHNYRRGKGIRTPGLIAPHCISMGLNSAHMRRNEPLQTFLKPNSSANPQQAGFNRCHGSDEIKKHFADSSSDFAGPSSIDSIEPTAVTPAAVRQSSSETPLIGDYRIRDMDLKDASLRCDVDDEDDDDLNSELNAFVDGDDEPIYATLSSRSCCSATTAANDDFEFYQREENEFTANNRCNEMLPSQRDENRKMSDEDAMNNGRTYQIKDCEILHRYQQQQRDIINGEERNERRQSKAEINNGNDVLKIVVPLLKTFANKEPIYQQEPICSQESETAKQIMKTVIENELKNSNKSFIQVKDNANKSTIVEDNVTQIVSVSTPLQEIHRDPHSNEVKIKIRSNETYTKQGLSAEDRKPVGGHKSAGPTKVASLSMSNLDEIEDDNKEDRRDRHLDNPMSLQDTNLRASKELIYELPVKSESVLSLYRGPLDASPTPSDGEACRRFYKQTPVSRRGVGQLTPLTRRLGQQTPPTRRLHRQKKALPVLSVESLTTALNQAGISYLDNGELCRHSRDISGSVPDFKRVFVSDFI